MDMRQRVPLVSVVVPNYNYSSYLVQRLESVLNQTFTDFELILLDDASTDDSLEVMERYRHNGHVTHVVVNERNTNSPFRQWMKGIRLARGKYVWIAEADDRAEPDFLETCVGWMERCGNVAVCYAGSVLFDAGGEVERRRDVNHWGKRRRKEAACFDGARYAACNLYWKNYIVNASAAVFRREYALNLEGTGFADLRYCGDWLFWFGMALQGQVVEVYRRLNYFRQHRAKVTVASAGEGAGIREDIRIVQYMESRLEGLSPYKKRLRRGLLYRKIKRMPLSKKHREELYGLMAATLGGSMRDYYLERRNQFLRLFLPRLLTAKRERL